MPPKAPLEAAYEIGADHEITRKANVFSVRINGTKYSSVLQMLSRCSCSGSCVAPIILASIRGEML